MCIYQLAVIFQCLDSSTFFFSNLQRRFYDFDPVSALHTESFHENKERRGKPCWETERTWLYRENIQRPRTEHVDWRISK